MRTSAEFGVISPRTLAVEVGEVAQQILSVLQKAPDEPARHQRFIKSLRETVQDAVDSGPQYRARGEALLSALGLEMTLAEVMTDPDACAARAGHLRLVVKILAVEIAREEVSLFVDELNSLLREHPDVAAFDVGGAAVVPARAAIAAAIGQGKDATGRSKLLLGGLAPQLGQQGSVTAASTRAHVRLTAMVHEILAQSTGSAATVDTLDAAPSAASIPGSPRQRPASTQGAAPAPRTAAAAKATDMPQTAPIAIAQTARLGQEVVLQASTLQHILTTLQRFDGRMSDLVQHNLALSGQVEELRKMVTDMQHNQAMAQIGRSPRDLP